MTQACYQTRQEPLAAMFDFAFSEIALVGVVALLVIGPKDMPVAIKAVTDVLKKARRMAGEFQGHVDEMVRDANLHEVRDGINDLRAMNIKGRILAAVDGDGTMRRALNDDPLKTPTAAVPPAPPSPAAEPQDALAAAPGPTPDPAPSFVPPGDAHSIAPPGFPSPAPAITPPSFIPPGAAPPHA